MNFEFLKVQNGHLREQLDHAIDLNASLRKGKLHLEKKIKAMRTDIDGLIEENKVLEKEVELLRAELADERDRFDKLSDFEVAESKDFREAKLYLRILLEHLQENGHDVEKLEKIIALKRCIMELEGENE